MPRGILDRLAEGPVLGDGGYLLELEKRGYVQAGPFTPEVAIEHPEALAELHREFMRAGAEFLTTMTFYASDDKLATVGMKDKVDEINRNAVKVAREVAGEGDALVAGDLSLTWAYDQQEPASADHVRALFDRQLQDMLDAGPPDFWVGETFSFVGEALLFVERARATGLPVRPQARRRRRQRRRRELPERPGPAAPDRARDAGSHIGLRGQPTRRLPDHGRPAGLHLDAELPVRAVAAPALPGRDGVLRPAGEGRRHQRDRVLLWLGRGARPGHGQGPGQAPRGRAGVEVGERQGHVCLRVLRPHRDRVLRAGTGIRLQGSEA